MIKEKYEELKNQYSDFNGDVFIKIDSPSKAPIYIGRTEKHTPYFMFQINEFLIEDIKTIKKTSGYILSFKNEEHVVKCRIEAANEDMFEVFFVVVEDLVSRVQRSDYGMGGIILQRLHMWEFFFKKARNGILDFQKQIGLWGELSFIRDMLNSGQKDIVSYWVGPSNAVKDFVIRQDAIEIKTSIINANNRIYISDENQLDDTGFGSLYLNVRKISQNQMDGESLSDLINEIEFLLNDSEQIDSFREKLMHVGYNAEFEDRYTDCFVLNDVYWYWVRDYDNQAFPRIMPSDLIKGVKFVSYQIELTTIAPFEISATQAKERIEGDIHG